MLRRILLPLEPSVYGINARQVALKIAAEHKATVTALVIVDRPSVERQVGPAPLGGGAFISELRSGRLAEIEVGLSKMVAAFEQVAHQAGVKYTIVREEADPADVIVREAMFHDMVVMGQRSDFDFDGESDPSRRYVQAVLDKGIAPVMILPKELPHRQPETVLVAFNGSLPSARALQRLPMLPWITQVKVKVLMADTNEAEAAPLLAKAADYLKAHDVPEVETQWTALPISEALSGEQLEWADIVVAGAHARSVLDFILGSVASHLIDQDKRAVLICG